VQRLFLGSVGLGALPGFLDGRARGLRVAFVPTSAKPMPDQTGVERDHGVLAELGLVVEDLDIGVSSRAQIEEALDRADAIFVEGGALFYLLEQALESGFAEALERHVRAGKPYIGMSSGALLVGPDIAPFERFTNRSLAPKLTSTRAIGLVDFVVLPHFDKRREVYDEMIAEYGSRFQLLPLTDGEAVLVEGDEYRVVDSL
jgi:dipeptidase E